MHTLLKTSLAACAVVLAGQSFAQVTFYQNENYQGPTFTVERQSGDLQRSGFSDRASSVVVKGNSWEVCENVNFSGRCVIMQPGNYPSLSAAGVSSRVSSVRETDGSTRTNPVSSAPVPAPAYAGSQVVFYQGENFQGRSFTAQNQIDDFTRYGFNDLAASAVVLGDRWEACENVRFGGRCVVMRPGRYPSLQAMGMTNRVSSVRAVNYDANVSDNRYAPLPVAVYDNRRRNDERLYEVNVTSVRAVTGPAEQRCWMERQPVAQAPADKANVGGAIVGALIGGILGHQVGGGRGKDLATVGGVVAGGLVGSKVGQNNSDQAAVGQDVQRCTTDAAQTQPAYWDVTYTFRGQEHRVQMTSAPGSTITVNGQGEPRA
jgi:uncharacterized protein YcfJ